jgi:antitoxin YefM
MMDTLTYSKLRANLKSALDRAVDDHEVITIKRANGDDAVILSKEDYSSLAETAYLLRSPANAKRLLNAAKRVNKSYKTSKVYKSVEELKNATGL